MAESISARLGLRSSLAADLRRQDRGVKRFAQSFKQSFKSVASQLLSVRGLIAGLGSGLTLAGIGRLIQSTISFDDRLSKLNERLGITVETLSALKFAGEQSGIEFNNLATGLQRATRRLAEFRSTGKGSAAPAIEALGIARQVRGGVSIEELLPTIADAFKDIADQGERVRVAFQLFDTEGVAIVQLLQKGSRALEELRDQAERAGAVITGKQAKAAADAADELNELKTIIRSLAQSIVRQLLPAIRNAAQGAQVLLGQQQLPPVSITGQRFPLTVGGLFSFQRPPPGVAPARPRGANVGAPFPTVEQATGIPTAEAFPTPGQAGLHISGGGARPIPTISGGLGIAGRFSRRRGQAAALAGFRQSFGGAPTNALSDALALLRARADTFQVLAEGALSLAGTLEGTVSNTVGRLATDFRNWKQIGKDAIQSLIGDLAALAARLLFIRSLGGILGRPPGASPQSVAFGGLQFGAGLLPFGNLAFGGSAQGGARFSGPRSGFLALLHGTEDVTQVRREPLPSGGRPSVVFVGVIQTRVRAEDLIENQELLGQIATEAIENDPRLSERFP